MNGNKILMKYCWLT